MKKIYLGLVVLLSTFFVNAQDLLITGVFDGPLPGGSPKGVELYVKSDIQDLSLYGVGSANNGGGTDGSEVQLSGSARQGEFLYVAYEAADGDFNTFFGFTPTFTDPSATNINGDDAMELFYDASGTFTGSETVIDVFGDINTDGSGQTWDYLDGWAYRKDGTGPDGASFSASSWTFSGINVFDGVSTNAGASPAFPAKSYQATGNVNPEPTNQVTALTATDIEFDRSTISWTEAVSGSQEPDGYLLLVSTSTITDPTDGVEPSADTDFSDGSGAILVSYAADDMYTLDGLSEATTYNINIYSYSNSGTDIDFKTDNTPSISFSTYSKVYFEDFESQNNLLESENITILDLDGSDPWFYSSRSGDEYAEITEYQGTGSEQDWMIVGPINFNAFTDEVFGFSSIANFVSGTPLTVKYSTDFSGDVQAASWTDLQVSLSTGNYAEVYSGRVDLSSLTSIGFIAFVYTEVEGQANGLFRIDDIKVSGTSSSTASSDITSATASNDLTVGTATTSGDVSVNDLTVTTSLTIASGHTVTVYGDLSVNGSLTIEDGGSLVTYGAVTGSASIVRTPTFNSNEGQYSAVGSPVAGAMTSALGSWVYQYDESVAYTNNNGGDRFKAVATPESMTPGDAYFTAFINGNLTFAGTPNTGGISQTMVYDETADGASDAGFNLVSNPFPSAISYSAFVDQNPKLDGTIYLWDDGGSAGEQRTNDDYIVVNAQGATRTTAGGNTSNWDGNIRSAQGFIVKATEAGDITFTNAMRTNGSNGTSGFIRSAEEGIIRLSISNGYHYSDILIGLRNDATLGVDRKLDAYKIKGNTDLQLYSMIDNLPYAIQGLPTSIGEHTINLGFDAVNEGSYTIKLEEGTFANHSIYLYDRQLDKIIDMNQMKAYSFSSGVASASNRFQLVLSPSAILGMENPASALSVYTANGALNIRTKDISGVSAIKVYSINGQLINAFDANINSELTSLPFNKKGLHIITVESANKLIVQKFIAK